MSRALIDEAVPDGYQIVDGECIPIDPAALEAFRRRYELTAEHAVLDRELRDRYQSPERGGLSVSTSGIRTA